MNGVSNFDVFIINILPFLPLHGEKKIDLKKINLNTIIGVV